jgi:hypothetical protein
MRSYVLLYEVVVRVEVLVVDPSLARNEVPPRRGRIFTLISWIKDEQQPGLPDGLFSN